MLVMYSFRAADVIFPLEIYVIQRYVNAPNNVSVMGSAIHSTQNHKRRKHTSVETGVSNQDGGSAHLFEAVARGGSLQGWMEACRRPSPIIPL